MTSHLCTMIMECILVYILFLTVTVSVSGIEIRKSPFGPLMCDRLCHHTVDCVYFFYAPQDLTCYLGNTPSACDREALKITVSKVVGNTSTDISNCPRNYKTYQSRSKKMICFNQNERRNPISNDARVCLQPAQPKTTTPTYRKNTAFVQCDDGIGLYQASEAGYLLRVQLIISKGLEDINCRGKQRRTPVMAAVDKGHEKLFDFLVSHCCDLHYVDYHNNTVLHMACKGGNDVIVKKIIDNGYFDVDIRGSSGKTPLMYAALKGNIRLFKILISKGSCVKKVANNKDTILHYASFNGNVEMTKYILSLNINGVGIESKGFLGRTPIMAAVDRQKRQLIEFLVSQGCNLSVVDYDGNTLLHLACSGGNIDIVKYILSLWTWNEKRKNKYGLTPVQLAESHNHSSVAALLRERQDMPKTATPTCRNNTTFVQCNDSIGLYQASEAGDLRRVQLIISKGLEDINCRGEYNRTPVMAAVRKGHEKLFDFLVSHCCDLYSVDHHRNTVLHMACKGGNGVIVKKLIDNGYFDVDIRGSSRRTPLMHAALHGHVRLFKILISQGSYVKTVDNHKNNILHLACFNGHVEMVKYILSLNIGGVDIDCKGFRGRTPIMVAVYRKRRQLIEFLVSQGCNLSVVDHDGNTILHLACSDGNIDIVKYIISLRTGNEKRKNKKGLTPVQLAESHHHSSVADLLREWQNMNILKTN